MVWRHRDHPDLHRFSRKSHRTFTQYDKTSIQEQDYSKGIGTKAESGIPSVSFLCSAPERASKKALPSGMKALSFYWAMCLCWKTCLGFRVQGFYWTMVTNAHMRSHNKWNFRLSEEKAGVYTQAGKTTLPVYQHFKGRFSRHQPRANLQVGLLSTTASALLLYGYSFWVQNLRENDIQKFRRIPPKTGSVPSFPIKVFSELNPL